MGTISEEILADTPDIYYKLTETSGTNAVDYSGNTRNGTYSGGVTLADRTSPKGTLASPLFDGINGKVGITARAYTGQFSIECWLYIPAGVTIDQHVGIFSNDGAAPDVNFFNARCRFYNGSGDVAVNSGPESTGGWHHYVITRDASNLITIYRDATADGTGTWSGTVTLAALARVSAGYSKMNMGYFAVYPTALSSTRITAHYNAAVDGLTDAATVAGTTTVSSTNVYAGVDSATISTTGSASSPTAYTDADTISGVTTPSGTDIKTMSDAATISSKVSLTYTDYYAVTEAATIKSVTTPDVIIEIPTTTQLYITISGSNSTGGTVTATITTEVTGGTTAGTGGGVVQTNPDSPSYTVTYSPSGYWGPADDDSGLIT